MPYFTCLHAPTRAPSRALLILAALAGCGDPLPFPVDTASSSAGTTDDATTATPTTTAASETGDADSTSETTADTTAGTTDEPTGEGEAVLAFPLVNVAGHCEVTWVRSGQVEGESLGRSLVELADVDGDDARDVALVATSPSRLERLSGSDGAPLGTSEYAGLGYARSAGGDLDGDGAAEIVAFAQECEDNGDGISSSDECQSMIRVLSASAGAELVVLPGEKGALQVTNGLLVVEDHDGDDKPDLLLGDPQQDPNVPGTLTHVSSTDLKVLGSLAAPGAAGPWIGGSLARLPDRDGDGRDEIVIGDASAQNFLGAVFVVGTSAQELLWQHTGGVEGMDPDLYGNPVIVAGDLSGDGAPDILAGAHNFSAGPEQRELGIVRALDGQTGALLWELAGTRPYEHFGGAFTSAGDLNGDGRAELIVGADSDPLGVQIDIGGRITVIDGATGQLALDVQHEVGEGEVEIYRFGGGVAFVRAVGPGQFDMVTTAAAADVAGITGAGQVIGLRCTLAAD